MAQAVKYVKEIVEEDGPYDCLIGFSQVGGRLVVRYWYLFV